MYIESIKLQGFKSFREEASLTFPHKITAIVGPNGSGKSNIADGFRWVLGEQSLKAVRSQESTDVIFSGSESQGKLSRAFVSIHFTLEKNAKGAVKGLSELEIARKLYRNGESSYTLNGKDVRLLDIHLLLAEHNVGQKNYAVIGQGMIDDVLKRSPKDRIDFFYEATGVKKHQIKLHKATLKLVRSKDRLDQSELLLKEITPHKKYLEKQVEKFTQREELVNELTEKQDTYYVTTYWSTKETIEDKQQNFSHLEKELHGVEEDIKELEREMQHGDTNGEISEERSSLEYELKEVSTRFHETKTKIESHEYEKFHRLESEGEVDVAFLHRRKREIEEMLERVQKERKDIVRSREELQKKEGIETGRLQEIELKIEGFVKNQDVSPERLRPRIQKILEFTSLDKVKAALMEILALLSGDEGGQRTELESERSEIQSTLDEMRVSSRIHEERDNLHKENEKRSTEELEDITLQEKKYARDSGKEWLRSLENQIAALKKELGEHTFAQEALEEKLRALNTREGDERERARSRQQEYQEQYEKRTHVEGLLQAVKIELTRLETHEQQLQGEMMESLGDLRIKNITEHKPESLGNHDLKKLRGEIRTLEREVASLGEIDGGVLEEYQEIKERFDFLAEQTGDLKEAIFSLEKITKQLKKTIHEQFSKQFKSLNLSFKKYFKELFNGGEARIDLIDIEGESEPGIDIVAHPPGKKIKHIGALSGGERSLVAVALICAIISSNPPPFVILDEIDAALDEANSNRLAVILKELSKNTQFIMITHNRATMEIADILYGVTMDNGGASNLVGVQLEDYEK